jgi:protein-L-isoaspartate(D-aspartate) O-methyltransferase
MAALLGHRGRHVTTLEIDPSLAASARINLQRGGITNADVVVADGAGYLTGALQATEALAGPFDVIVLSGSVAAIPQRLLALLRVGGRLGTIVGNAPVMRATLVTRVDQDAWRTTQAWDTVAPRLLNFPEPSKFSF